MRIEEIFEIAEVYPSWLKIGKIKLYKQIREQGFVLLNAEVHNKQEVHFWRCWDNEFGGGRSVRYILKLDEQTELSIHYKILMLETDWIKIKKIAKKCKKER